MNQKGLFLILTLVFSLVCIETWIAIEQKNRLTSEIQALTIKIDQMNSTIDSMNNTIIILTSENAKLVLTVEEKDRAIREFESQVKKLKNSLENSSQFPDLQTLKSFLAEDKTNTHAYVKGSYECEEFALDLQKSAYKKGYFLSVQYVTVGFLEQYGWKYQAPRAMTHVCNLAFVIDNNAFYIVEPQTDKIALLSYAD